MASGELRDLSLGQGSLAAVVSLRKCGGVLTTGFGQGDAMRQQPPILRSLI